MQVCTIRPEFLWFWHIRSIKGHAGFLLSTMPHSGYLSVVCTAVLCWSLSQRSHEMGAHILYPSIIPNQAFMDQKTMLRVIYSSFGQCSLIVSGLPSWRHRRGEQSGWSYVAAPAETSPTFVVVLGFEVQALPSSLRGSQK